MHVQKSAVKFTTDSNDTTHETKTDLNDVELSRHHHRTAVDRFLPQNRALPELPSQLRHPRHESVVQLLLWGSEAGMQTTKSATDKNTRQKRMIERNRRVRDTMGLAAERTQCVKRKSWWDEAQKM